MFLEFHLDKALDGAERCSSCSHVFDTDRARKTRDTNRTTLKWLIRVTSKKHAMKN